MIVFVNGVSGVGKSTVIEKTKEISIQGVLKIEQAKVKETLCELGGVKTVEEYRLLPEKTRSSLHTGTTERIYMADLEDVNIVRLYDIHLCSCSHCDDSEIIRPFRADDGKHIVLIITLVARPENVLVHKNLDLRIRGDRHITSIDFVVKEQRRAIETAEMYSKVLNIPAKIVSNNGGLDETCFKILNIIEDVIKNKKEG